MSELSKTSDITQRQNQVYQLHFDYGYNSEKISNLLNVKQKTIEDDLEYCYDKKQREDNELSINEELIRHIILFLILKYAKNPRLEEKSIKSEIINLENCTIQQAESVYNYMQGLGLHYCSVMAGFEYDLLQFALLRRYTNKNDIFVKSLFSLCMLYNIQPFEKSDMLKQFTEEHGDKKDWNDITHENYSEKLDELNKKHAKTSSEIFVQAFEGIKLDANKFNQYTQYITTPFNVTNDKQLFERMFDD